MTRKLTDAEIMAMDDWELNASVLNIAEELGLDHKLGDHTASNDAIIEVVQAWCGDDENKQHIYGRQFLHLVYRINKSIAYQAITAPAIDYCRAFLMAIERVKDGQ